MPYFFCHFDKEEYSCDDLFASLYDKGSFKWNMLLSEIICSYRIYIYIYPFLLELNGGGGGGSKTVASPESVSIHLHSKCVQMHKVTLVGR